MMRKTLSPVLVLLLVASVGLTGCATKKWVNEQVSAFGQVTNTKIHEVQDATETNQAAISELAADQKALAADVAKLSATTKDALKRAEAAGVLAQGKFLFEVTMTDNDHTDNIGSEGYNLKLGHKRAEHAMRYLNMEQGIPLFRMNVISYGEYKPIGDNSTKAGRAENRRVTLVAMQ
jgi:outer membrane protein OmpA-like peptidoglycan-associated protein